MSHKKLLKWLRSSWGWIQVYLMTLAILLFSIYPARCLDTEIDLLSELNLYKNFSSYHGISRATQSYRNGSIAFQLETNTRTLMLPHLSYQKIADLIKNSADFTLSAILKQEKTTAGSIISFSYERNRYLELESSGIRNEIRFYYTYQTPNGQIQNKMEAFSYHLADGNWHKIALSVSGPEIQLIIDCHPIYKRVNHFIPDRNFSASDMQLFVGQSNSYNQSQFKGFIHSAHVVVRPHGYTKQCPHMQEHCPTCSQFNLLQRTVDELQKSVIDLTQMLVAAESRISLLEECDCKIPCKLSNGTITDDGYKWKDGCNICECRRGKIICESIQCEPVTCPFPEFDEQTCCKKCQKKCFKSGKGHIEHGVTIKENCGECNCNNGSLTCKQKECEEPQCPKELQIQTECCPVCKGDDYCAKGHACDTNATCLNLYTKYTCTCRQGFQGDGFQCSDIDECAQEGGRFGNHCHLNARCVNLPGDYKCECLPGYDRHDKFNCIDINECSISQNKCHNYAKCFNTQGSYKCKCIDGYEGDGFDCKPVCNQTCLHGGICSEPNVCNCRPEFTGDFCELDVDECVTGLHKCKSTADCVNMPGWYYCKCKSGYNLFGKECMDIDECIINTHTCHSTAKCINTDGHFMCHCSPNDKDCKLSCMFDDMEIPNGSKITPPNKPCTTCTCDQGVITCEEPKCNCSNWNTTQISNGRDICCPQCDPNETCRHQELNLSFKSGETWIYRCQTCECLYGELDCWQFICPPLNCENPLPLADGDCCQRCPDDLICSKNDNITIALKNQCLYNGVLYSSGQIFSDPSSQCTTCDCKDGELFCTVNDTCNDNNMETNKISISNNEHNTTTNNTVAINISSTSEAPVRTSKSNRFVREILFKKNLYRQRNIGRN